MCGIVGILGEHEVSPIILEALRRLEYRGYDSAGIATIHDGALDRRRAVGKLVNLSDHLVHHPLPGKSGIGHTRWATHGKPTEVNAHPHRAGPVAVVHNGIIENFAALREELRAKNYGAESDTDTETVALLCQSFLDGGASPVEAVRQTLKRLDGAFALAFLFDDHPDLMIAARRGSPLAIAHNGTEAFVGSDAIALAPMSDRLIYLDEGDWAVMSRSGYTVFDENDQEVDRPVTRIAETAGRVEKGGHRHWMSKEIAEQPAVIDDCLRYYVKDGTITFLEGAIDFTAFDRIVMVACGTGSYACHVAKYWFERLARIPVEIDIASEFRYREPPLNERVLAIFVSQSGETADTLAALRYAKDTAFCVSVINVPGSSIARDSRVALPIHAGAEIGVASTKAFTTSLAVLGLMALKAGLDRGALGADDFAAHLNALGGVPALVSQALNIETQIEDIARDLSEARDILFLGRGALYPLALEGALKMKEISYIHAEGYASGELKHGPIALVDDTVPIITFAPSDALFGKTVSNMQEVMARGGRVVLVSDAKGLAAEPDAWATLEMPACPDLWAPILYAVPAQLLAYHTALAKGTDVDQPRNLAKSVTVE
ncbi:Glutamine--fructose-6-phosphate aminotransferase [isomerizing] [Rhodobacteraceae bacterium THAF1]|uniref:glutamine--fructose-6-phosphate transaminase (isomerizing) n=1 Tax=Palleronia sp. THAF1 TaxID=2587842 RepID=UPI000F40AE50|nr:glutamine--fructose-6-phosphate transaminase (isomerizing) [Palleronia sp. THAF1]QFU08324.1 Glutamine--fructose-6-phosphate aminotransferase [isomerizing] [Palleronia sp. THAF1]VDC28965.1 Glutamine--fructose-6-phosphate aminotransferase [isomerizing] [Rhodobacteraceae bacterium THAF1]